MSIVGKVLTALDEQGTVGWQTGGGGTATAAPVTAQVDIAAPGGSGFTFPGAPFKCFYTQNIGPINPTAPNGRYITGAFTVLGHYPSPLGGSLFVVRVLINSFPGVLLNDIQSVVVTPVSDNCTVLRAFFDNIDAISIQFSVAAAQTPGFHVLFSGTS